jgi:hypothetical protein
VEWGLDVSAAGTGSPVPESPIRLNVPGETPSPPAGIAFGTAAEIASDVRQDSAGPFLQLLSTPAIQELLHGIETHRFAQDPAAIESIIQTAASAVASHDLPRAIAALSEHIGRNPEHAAALANSPSLAQIQGEVRELVHRVTEEARTEAVRLVASAGVVVDAAAKHPPQLDGPAVLEIAERFIESGQLANYIRAQELGQVVIGSYAAVGRRVGRAERQPAWEWVVRFWRRVPLLVLMVGWLALGLAGSAIALLVRLDAATVQAGFEFWGIGFLGLVVIQFWIKTGVFR